MDTTTTPKRQDARAVRSRAAMQQALLTLLAQTPLSGITGTLVSETAGVGYSTFFRHYADVNALLLDTVGDLAEELGRSMLPALLRSDASAATLQLVHEVDARRAQIAALLGGAGDAMRVQLGRMVAQRLSALPDLSPNWLPHRLALRIAVATTVELCEWWLLEQPETPAPVVAGMLDKLVIAPILGT